MAQPRKVRLCPEQVSELQRVRDHHPKPYMQERAAAILKVAAGQAQMQVAAGGLNKRRARSTVSIWITRYEQDGLEGLAIKAGRGRKPAFSPCKPD